jgi:4-hydroxybenzoate polyprenyltransferase
MNKTIHFAVSFLRLIRYPNLFFIALTQTLFYFKIVSPLFGGKPLLSTVDFFLLMTASVAIAAAGYVINDYFDMDIDFINKPERMIIGRNISRRWAMLIHMLLSLTGLFLTAVVSMHLGSLWLLFLNFLSVFLLLLYSSTFKKKLIIGNIIISLLTSWVVISLFVSAFKWNDLQDLNANQLVLSTLYKFTIAYASFAFVVSLIREVVKDAEDQIGDRQYGCTTMPIKWGQASTKIFLFVWLFVLSASLFTILVAQSVSIALYDVFNFKTWIQVFFLVILFIQLGILVRKLKRASVPVDYSGISRDLKLFMLTGILTMLSL